MGNLCSSEAKDIGSADDVSIAGSDGHGEQATRKASTAKGHAGRSAPPANPIDAALSSARHELERCGKDFESHYTVSKLIGHGAFAKVSICEHKTSHTQYAAKVVSKNHDEPEKQREGGLHCARIHAQ